ncbi:MAG: MFS transporter [Alphaproteobacteria bacterium]|nr:MFS transporter [Alphaproteobacteria bacterium]
MTPHSATPPGGPGEASIRYAGWRVVAVCYLAAVFCWGFGLYGHGVYLAELNRLHGWSTTAISSATTVFYLATAALVVFVSDAIARLGPRLVMLVGAACFGAAMLLLATMSQLWQLFPAYLIMAVGAATMHVGAISNVIGLWFVQRRGLALSLALNGASSGGILVTPMLLLAITHAGFEQAMTGAALAFAFLLLPVLAWGIAHPPRQAATPGAPPPAASWTRRRALRIPAFWSVAAPFALALTAQVGFLVHQVAFLQPLLGRAEAGISVAVLTVCAIAGRFMLGAIANRVDIRKFSAWSMASQAAALALMIWTAQPAALYFACAVYGLSAGNLITLPSLAIQREFEAASFGMLVGLSWAICQFTYAFGPGLLGAIRDATGGYAAPIALCVALKLAAALLVLIKPKAAAA